ncbi:MAG: hypothetical protein P0S95_07115 [Rhabdochlamydiaceae bacterium]|nr:hypothetical protein [Candidatus Amphrikana amoebophyrae]
MSVRSVRSVSSLDDFDCFLDPGSDEALNKKVINFSSLSTEYQSFIRELAKDEKGLSILDLLEGKDVSSLNKEDQSALFGFIKRMRDSHIAALAAGIDSVFEGYDGMGAAIKALHQQGDQLLATAAVVPLPVAAAAPPLAAAAPEVDYSNLQIIPYRPFRFPINEPACDDASDRGYDGDSDSDQAALSRSVLDSEPLEAIRERVYSLLLTHGDAVDEGRRAAVLRAIEERKEAEAYERACAAAEARQAELEAEAKVIAEQEAIRQAHLQRISDMKALAVQIQEGGEGSAEFIDLLNKVGVNSSFFHGSSIREIALIAALFNAQRFLDIQTLSKRFKALSLVTDIIQAIRTPTRNWDEVQLNLMRKLIPHINNIRSARKKNVCRNNFSAIFKLMAHPASAYIVISKQLTGAEVSQDERLKFSVDRVTALCTWLTPVIFQIVSKLSVEQRARFRKTISVWPQQLHALKSEERSLNQKFKMACNLCATVKGVTHQVAQEGQYDVATSQGSKDLIKLSPVIFQLIKELDSQRDLGVNHVLLPTKYVVPDHKAFTYLKMTGGMGETSERAELARVKVPLHRCVEALKAPLLRAVSADANRFDQGFRYQLINVLPSCVELLKLAQGLSDADVRGAQVALGLNVYRMTHQAFSAAIVRSGKELTDSMSLKDMAFTLGIWTTLNSDQRKALRSFDRFESVIGTAHSVFDIDADTSSSLVAELVNSSKLNAQFTSSASCLVDLSLSFYGVEPIEMNAYLQKECSVVGAGIAPQDRVALRFSIQVAPLKLSLIAYSRDQAASTLEVATASDLVLNLEQLSSLTSCLTKQRALAFLPALVVGIQHSLRHAILLSERLVEMARCDGALIATTSCNQLNKGAYHAPYNSRAWAKVMAFIDVDSGDLALPYNVKADSPSGVKLPFVASGGFEQEYVLTRGGVFTHGPISLDHKQIENSIDELLGVVAVASDMIKRNIEAASY